MTPPKTAPDTSTDTTDAADPAADPGAETPPSDVDVNLGLDQAEPGQDAETGDGGKARGSRSAYLPVLPEGWFYEVTLHGPGGTSVDVKPVRDDFDRPTAASPHTVLYRPANDDTRLIQAADLAEAARTAASGAKLLDRLYKGEEEVRRAREEALSVLGSPDAPSTAPSDR